MKSARHLTTATFGDKGINLQQEKATLINLILTIKAIFSRKTLINVKDRSIGLFTTTASFVKSGIFLRTCAMVMSIIWMLIIISTVFFS